MTYRHTFSPVRLAALGVLACGISAGPAAAQQYPSQNITFIVAFAPGGVADTVARLVGQKLSERLGQSVVVENRGGAGGNIGARFVANAPPDGYTVLVTTTALAINDTVFKNKGYDTADLRTVAIAASTPELLAVHPSNPAKTLGEFVRAAKEKPINFGTAGVGTGSYIAAEYFFHEIAKIKTTHVPFSGGAPVVAAAVGGHIDLVAVSLPSAVAQINEGALRGLGVANPTRAPAVPSVPTYAEAGYPNFYAASWVGFFVPTKTKDQIVDKLNTEVNAILAEPAVQEKLKTIGFDAIRKSRADASSYFESEVKTWGNMARTIGLSVN
ncbi:MAG TPA: tripartite tricarboxylate transporter substrate binding protein [Xanthobacteraceae bacterium]|nr:tripartite tricarboxylate transporter substrate binding protein [Xanthobacteraceae bacterium]